MLRSVSDDAKTQAYAYIFADKKMYSYTATVEPIAGGPIRQPPKLSTKDVEKETARSLERPGCLGFALRTGPIHKVRIERGLRSRWWVAVI